MNKHIVLISLLLTGCSSEESPSKETEEVEINPIETSLVFTDATSELGISLFHANKLGSSPSMPSMFSGGVATEDYDNDGDLDFYLVAGENGTNQLYQNQGNGTFIEVAQQAGVAISGNKSTGPTFADMDGDGWLDLIVGAVDYDDIHVYINNQDGTFTDVTEESGLKISADNSISATFGDIDGDGDIDLFLTHWGHKLYEGDSVELLWRNDSTVGSIQFTDISEESGLNQGYQDQYITEQNPEAEPDSSFVPSISDFDFDGDLDLLLVSDYGLTKVFRNDGGIFTPILMESIIDQFGMGSAIGDIDNDGDMDWFVTSIAQKASADEDKNPTADFRGNTLYSNDGTGFFTNVSITRGVDDGGWGWGACIADFNNDSFPDIYHVNGWGQNGQLFAMFIDDESRLFINNGDNSFTESAAAAKVNDANQGRGLSCNDFDNDGDIDILISNNQGPAKFYRNDLVSSNHYIKMRLIGHNPNVNALGARVEVKVHDALTLTQEVRLNNHVVSQSASELHFGLGQHNSIEKVTVYWPDGELSEYDSLSISASNLITQPE